MSRFGAINPLMTGATGAGSSRMLANLAPLLAQQASAGTVGVGTQLGRAGEQSAARQMQAAMTLARLRQAAQLEAQAQQAQRQRDLMDALATAAQVESREAPEAAELADEDAVLLDDMRDVVFQAKQSLLNLTLDPTQDADGAIRRNLQAFIDESLANAEQAMTSEGGRRAIGNYAKVFGSRKPIETDEAAEGEKSPAGPSRLEPRTNPFRFFDAIGSAVGRFGQTQPAADWPAGDKPFGSLAGVTPTQASERSAIGGSLLRPDQVPTEIPGSIRPAVSQTVDMSDLGRFLELYEGAIAEPAEATMAEKQRRWRKAARRR